MWSRGWRDRIWRELDQPWDMIVVGGGITGAGIVREAARAGLRVLLLEANDFASGTSSRSGKLVHGGLRYLQNAEIKLTRDSVAEREHLLKEGRGLINPLPFLLASFPDDRPPAWVFGAGLMLYDVLALKWGHQRYRAQGLCELCPQLEGAPIIGGYRYFDAQTDDARLVLRVIREAVRGGATALNYACVQELLGLRSGRVAGVVLQDRSPEGRARTQEVQARVVVNATGAWADLLRHKVGGSPRLRRLRGSHLVLPWARLPLWRAVTFLHPADHRALYAYPWEGVILVGTTDVDHGDHAELDPTIQPEEAEYLLAGLRRVFPGHGLERRDIQATFSGLRPVVDTGKADPCKESREYALWEEQGLLTVAGGKLTTFRLMAHAGLSKVKKWLPGARLDKRRVLDKIPGSLDRANQLAPPAQLRLAGRYGADALALVDAAEPGELDLIGGSMTRWAELRWAARAEGVVHLEDLLLRRVRLGLELPEGGAPWMQHIREIVQPELRWDDDRWARELTAYTRLWNASYAPPRA